MPVWRTTKLLVTLCTISTLLVSQTARANPDLDLPGWKTGSRSGIELSGSDISYSSPAVADLDGDESNGLEVVLAGADGKVYALHADGTLLWEATLPIHRCTKMSDSNKVFSSPAIGALFGDGIPYVVLGFGGIGSKACGGGVIALNGRTGEKRWILNLRRFAKVKNFWAFSNTVFSTIALADTNGNGKLEIGFGSFDRNVYFLNARGKVLWYYNAADTVWSSPAFANVDSSPNLEMILGTDISGNSALQPPTRDGGYVYAFKTTKGRRVRSIQRRGRRADRFGRAKHYGFRDSSAFVWQKPFDQTIFSAPSVADILPDSPGLEIAVASGCFFPQDNSDKRGKWVKILRASDGETLMTLAAPACSESSPALGDLDGDGLLEVVATVNGDTSIGGDGKSRLVVWRTSSPDPWWSAIPRDTSSHDTYGAHFSSPTIADLDGNGSNEVIVANGQAVHIFDGQSGDALTCTKSACGAEAIRLSTGSTIRATPAIADLDHDGTLEVVIGSSRGSVATAHAWGEFTSALSSADGPETPYATPWPMFRGSSSRQALFQSTP